MLSRLKTIIQLVVPEYTITFITFVAIFISLNNNLENIYLLIIPFFVYIFSIFGFNVLNQLFDLEIDKISKKSRPLISGKLSKKFIIFFSISLYFTSFLISLISNLMFEWFLILIVTSLYNNHFFKLRKSIITVPIFGVINYVLIPFLLVVNFFNLQMNYLALLFFSSIILCISFLKDIEGDKKVGFKSIPILIGVKKSIKLSFNLIIILVLLFGTFFSFFQNPLFIIPTIISLLLTLFLFNINLKNLSNNFLILFMILAILIQVLFSIFFHYNNMLFGFNFLIIYLILAYFFMSFGLKYVDEAFDSNTFNKKIAKIITPLLILIGIFSIYVDAITAVFISGYVLGVLITKKVDIKEHFLFAIGWLVAILLLGIYTYLLNNFLLLIIFIILTIIDEKSNNFADNYLKSKKNTLPLIVIYFFRFRSIVFVGTIILFLFNLISFYYILFVFLWLLGYNIPIIVSDARKKLA